MIENLCAAPLSEEKIKVNMDGTCMGYQRANPFKNPLGEKWPIHDCKRDFAKEKAKQLIEAVDFDQELLEKITEIIDAHAEKKKKQSESDMHVKINLLDYAVKLQGERITSLENELAKIKAANPIICGGSDVYPVIKTWDPVQRTVTAQVEITPMGNKKE